ncbi:copper transporter [Kordiimonas sediminis]|uniref:Copper transporter n=1 Tax=Kordiimonas sediminis TaxID=1735581 RepID=A0A919E6N8_9PROT|nr:TolC family protein [Kordiimonas sediminis]GHF19353.1 copper transporter [Kordiimonas sediminis]
MYILNLLTRGLVSLSIFSVVAWSSDVPLTLDQTVSIALQRQDASVQTYSARAASEDALAVSAGQLPDPKVKFGVANIAADSFDFNQEPMTQLQFGVHQTFLTGKKRSLARLKGHAQGDAYRHMARARELAIMLEVRTLWLNIHMLENVRSIIVAKQQQMQSLQDAITNDFAQGDSAARFLFQGEAELALLADKIEDTDQKIFRFRAMLGRYVGQENAARPISGGVDLSMPKPSEVLPEFIEQHPRVQREEALVEAAEKGIALAEEAYKPNVGLDLGYGVRAGGRSDMASAMISVDVPLFTEKRQDKILSASKQARQSSMLAKQSVVMDMLRDMRASFEVWTRSAKRIELYQKVVLDRARAASEATERSYAAGSADFSEIIGRHISELDAHLALEKIKFERAAAQAELLYLEGAGA